MRLTAKFINFIANRTKIRVLPSRLLHPQDPKVQTLRIPGYVQTQPHTCGYVAALMILHYFRPDFKSERLYERIRPTERYGVSRNRLMDVLCSCNLRVRWRNDLNFQGIASAIDLNRPIALVVNKDLDVKHWVVCYGYGRSPNRLYIAANGLQCREYPYNLFKAHLWETPGFGLVCAAK